MEDLENKYIQWKADIQEYIQEVESWEDEIVRGRKDLEQIRQALSKHSMLVKKHGRLLKVKGKELNNRVSKLRSIDEDTVLKLERSHMTVLDFYKLEKIAHETMKQAHKKLTSVIVEMKKKLD
ncbi:MAG: hypothetical protein HKN92_00285 [Chitinophagales bacterium]|nr:hypothetical protein [Chitinophagales bacterium]